MEEYKNIKEIIELCEEELNNNNENVTATLDLIDLKELRNLLNKNKELEENQIVINKEIRNGKPVIANTRLTIIDVLSFMAEFIKRNEEEFRKNYADISIKQIISAIDYFIDDSIPKSKVKEKIEELENKIQENTDEQGYWGSSDYETQIEVLEELLEKE